MRSRISRPTVIFLAAVSLGGYVASPAAGAATKKESTTPAKPTAVTGAVGHVTGTNAVLGGSVNPHTFATTYYFQYGPTNAYGKQTATGTVGPGTVAVKVSQPVTGLLAGYHYRLVATNPDGTDLGRDRVFTIKSKKKKLAFTLADSFPPTVYKHSFLFSGTLTGPGSGNRAIVLQATPYPYTTPYTNVAGPILTGPTGAFAFRVPNLTRSTRFRVATVSAPVVLSKVVGEQVQASITLKAQPTRRKGVYRLYGTILPAERGARVFFEIEKKAKAKPPKVSGPIKPTKSPGGSNKSEAEKGPNFSAKFSTVVKGPGGSVSHYSVMVTIRDTGRYRAVVQVRPGPLVAGSSRVIVLHGAPPKTKGKKKAANKKTHKKKGKHAATHKAKHKHKHHK